jgi:hypothetical protein
VVATTTTTPPGDVTVPLDGTSEMDSVRGDGASGGFRRAGCCGIVRIRLRRLAARVHGRKSQRLISSIRRVASSLTSRRATMADRLATSALDGIGR